MRAWSKLARRLRRLAPWWVVACFGSAIAPMVAATPHDSRRLVLLLSASALVVGVLATSWPAPRPSRARWPWCVLALVMLVGAPLALELVDPPERDRVFGALSRGWWIARNTMDHFLPFGWPVTLAVAWLMIDTRARPDLREGDRARRVFVGAAALVVAGAAASELRGPLLQCIPPFQREWCGPRCCAGPVDARLLASTLALLVVLSAFRRRWTRSRLPLAGVAAWLASRIVSDAAAGHAAMVSYEATWTYTRAGFAALNRCAVWTTVIEGALVGIAVAIAGWVIVRVIAFRRRDAALARVAGAVWPVVPVLVLASGVAVDYPPPASEPIWRIAGIEPMRWSEGRWNPFSMTESPDAPSFVLDRGGGLTAFGGGPPRALHRGEVVWMSNGSPTVAMVFDRRATLGDLRAAVPHLRLASGVELAFLIHDDDPSPLARRRWGAVRDADRIVSARTIWFARRPRPRAVEHPPLPLPACPHSEEPPGAHAIALEGPDDLLLERILRETESRMFLVVSAELEPHEHVVDASTVQWRPPETRTLTVSIPPLAPAIAALGLLALAVLALARDVRQIRSLGLRMPVLYRSRGRTPARRVPEWIPSRAIEWLVLADLRHGYRERLPTRVAIPPERALPGAVAGLIARALGRGAWGVVRWAIVFGLAGAIGLVLAALLHA